MPHNANVNSFLCQRENLDKQMTTAVETDGEFCLS